MHVTFSDPFPSRYVSTPVIPQGFHARPLDIPWIEEQRERAQLSQTGRTSDETPPDLETTLSMLEGIGREHLPKGSLNLGGIAPTKSDDMK